MTAVLIGLSFGGGVRMDTFGQDQGRLKMEPYGGLEAKGVVLVEPPEDGRDS